MTAKDHSKLLGILFAIHAALYSFGILIGLLIYGGGGIYLLAYGKRDEQPVGIIFLVMAVIVFIVALVLIIPQILAALKLLKNKSRARFWAIFAAITSLISFPLGTALGIYALWFLFGEQGKQFYNAGGAGQMPPPPPQNWR